ncbi:MAG: HAD family hydrolase [Dehalococcoidia bacterium]
MFRAVLFDVGGPIDTEVRFEQLVDRDIRAAFGAEGVAVSDAAYADADARAVAAFAPDAYSAITWTLAGGDAALAARVMARFRNPEAGARRQTERGGIELRPGIVDLLRWLHGEGILLGLAANQPARVVAELDALGCGALFSHREVTGHHRLRKPDVRLFLRACDDLGVAPEKTIMVGDRIDNDIAPARWLGMAAIRLRTGRHANQQPRAHDEVPHADVDTVPALRDALARLLHEGEP